MQTNTLQPAAGSGHTVAGERHTRISRRGFLKNTALTATAVAMPAIIPARALGRGGAVAPSERIVIAGIGVGGRMRGVLEFCLPMPELQCVAMCDCYADRRRIAKEMVDSKYGNKDCVATRFHEEVLARPDIDAVFIGTGDRWHAPLSMLAARAGKDVYCEKPFCMTIGEGRTLVETMRRFGTVWQCGTQRRSLPSYRFVAEAVRGGMIGRLHSITTNLGGWGAVGEVPKPEPQPAPDVFDYERWLGPSPWRPYSAHGCETWRTRWETNGGVIADMGAHFFDIVQWANNSELSGPVEYEGTGSWANDGYTNVPLTVEVEARYADGVRLLIRSGDKGIRFEGDEGWIHITDMGEITAQPQSILKARGIIMTNSIPTDEHVGNLIKCIRTRRQTVSNPELAHRAHTIVHCANLCLRLGRKLRWNPVAERFVDDEEADRMMFRTMRAPWRA